MQAAAWRRHLLDHHLSPASSAAIAAFRSASQPQGLGGADGARYMSARAPAVKGAGHLVRKGTGGRSSVSGIIATVFGATGFLGRYLVQQLAKMGSQVLVPFRGSEDSHRHLKLMGDLGQIVPMKYNPRDVNSIKAVMAKSNVVINLIGREYETRNYGFEDVNHHMAEQLAMISKEHGGIVRFIQVSCLGASASSPSRMLRAKAAGEESVLKEFPEATIMRPATMIGTEDRILNRWAQFARNWSFLPLVGGGSTKWWIWDGCLPALAVQVYQAWLLFLYTSFALRENVLIVNGSDIRPWWIYHHYLAMLMALVSLTWEIKGQADCSSKQRGVQLFLRWAIMQGIAMHLQNRYQRQRLRTRIALGKAKRMDVVAGETAGVEGQLLLLYPVLFILQGFEAYVGVLLLQTALHGLASEWQVVVCGILLVVMAVGNFVNTVETLTLKLRFKAKMKRAKGRQDHGHSGQNRPHQN